MQMTPVITVVRESQLARHGDQADQVRVSPERSETSLCPLTRTTKFSSKLAMSLS